VSEWQDLPLSEVVDLVGGGTPKTTVSEYWNGDIPWLSVVDFNTGRKYVADTEKKITKAGYENSSTKLLNAGDIILSARGTVGAMAVLSKPMAFNQSCYGLRGVANKSDTSFIYYLVKDAVEGLQQISHGGVFDTITRDTFKDITLPIPPLKEQKAIASVLSSLDDKIDLLHRQNTTLERIAETLFRQWFVEEAQSFKLGKIGDLIEGTFGGDWGKEAPEGDFINAGNCIRGTDIADLQTGLAKKIPLRFVSTKKLQSIEPKNGDIIFEISGGTETQSTGRATYINNDVRSLFAYPLIFSNFCRLLRPLNPDYTYFIYLYLSYLYGQDEFFGLENGSSGIKNLNYKALFFELDYPMPTLDRVQEFNNLVTPSFSKINQNKKQIQTLEKLRDNLLPKLMSGEVRVNN